MAKKSVKKKKELFSVEVSYDAKFYFDYSIDNPDGPEKVIPRYLKKEDSASGMGMGRRDLVFYFPSRKAADAIEGKIAKAPFQKKWNVSVSEVCSVTT